MGFWQKVDDELEFTGMTRKELAAKAQFPDSYISKGISRNSVPSADLALHIAHALNVSLEYLLDMPEQGSAANGGAAGDGQERRYRKYRSLIEGMEKLTPKKQDIVMRLCLSLQEV